MLCSIRDLSLNQKGMPSKKRKDIPSEYVNLVDKTCYIYLEIWDEIYSTAQYANIYPRNVTEYYVLGKYGIDNKGLFVKLDKTKWGNCEFYINEKITIEHAPIEKPLNRIELTYEMYEKYELPVKIAMEKEKTTKKRKAVPDKRMKDLPNNSYKRMKDLPDVVLSALKYQMDQLNQRQTEIVQKYWGILIMVILSTITNHQTNKLTNQTNKLTNSFYLDQRSSK
jgi:replicative superfamily II helicase